MVARLGEQVRQADIQGVVAVCGVRANVQHAELRLLPAFAVVDAFLIRFNI